MKAKCVMVVAMALLASFSGIAQSYYAENELTVWLKELKPGPRPCRVYSKKNEITVNLETSQMSFFVDFSTFAKKDTACPYKILSIFPPLSYPSISFKVELPFNKLAKDISGPQVFELQGILGIGGRSYPVLIPIQFEFLDKQLLFDMSFTLDLTAVDMSLPAEYRDKLSTKIKFEVDNGKLIYRIH